MRAEGMKTLRVYLEGVGVWSPSLANVDALRLWLTGRPPITANTKPPATILPANERRRAPESVLIAAEVAAQAVAASGRAASTLTCVFASAFGDQTITDYLCATLAHAPNELSPTRFHNSVHNAPAGYWTIATDCQAPSNAVCAGRASFGAGLLEAATQACADEKPVLLVCSDIAGTGPLAEITGCHHAFGCALVLSPKATARGMGSLDLQLTLAAPSGPDLPADAAAWIASNPSATALSLLALLANNGGDCVLAASDQLGLRAHWETTHLKSTHLEGTA